jgi:hypothetical protein
LHHQVQLCVLDCTERIAHRTISLVSSRQQLALQGLLGSSHRALGGVHHRHSPLQAGLGCFEQLAEHLRL